MDIEFLDLIHEQGTKLFIKKNRPFYQPDDSMASNYAYYLESGACALTCLTKDGEEKIYLYFSSNRLVNFNPVMMKNYQGPYNQTHFFLVAKTNCVVYQLHEHVLNNLLKESKSFNTFLLDVLSQNYVDALNRFHQIQEESATIRLCRLLLTHSDENHNKRILPDYFTYSEISKFLGIHPVTVARIMAKLKHYGYISKEGHSTIILKIEQLKNLIESGMDLDY